MSGAIEQVPIETIFRRALQRLAASAFIVCCRMPLTVVLSIHSALVDLNIDVEDRCTRHSAHPRLCEWSVQTQDAFIQFIHARLSSSVCIPFDPKDDLQWYTGGFLSSYATHS